MSEATPTSYEKAVDYRLNNIEKAISELKDVVVENKLQARDIQDLHKMCMEILAAVNSHDKRIKDLEIAPVQAKADKWLTIVDIIVKLMLGGLGTVITILVTKTFTTVLGA